MIGNQTEPNNIPYSEQQDCTMVIYQDRLLHQCSEWTRCLHGCFYLLLFHLPKNDTTTQTSCCIVFGDASFWLVLYVYVWSTCCQRFTWILVLLNIVLCSFIFSGCCFVTFYTRKSALDAQNALHNIKTMPGVSSFFFSHFYKKNYMKVEAFLTYFVKVFHKIP